MGLGGWDGKGRTERRENLAVMDDVKEIVALLILLDLGIHS